MNRTMVLLGVGGIVFMLGMGVSAVARAGSAWIGADSESRAALLLDLGSFGLLARVQYTSLTSEGSIEESGFFTSREISYRSKVSMLIPSAGLFLYFRSSPFYAAGEVGTLTILSATAEANGERLREVEDSLREMHLTWYRAALGAQGNLTPFLRLFAEVGIEKADGETQVPTSSTPQITALGSGSGVGSYALIRMLFRISEPPPSTPPRPLE